MLIAGSIVVAVVVVGVLGYGLITELVIKARSPVALVGETEIRTDEFQSRVKFLRANIALQLEQWRQQRREIDPAGETADLVLDYVDQNISQLEATLSEANKLAIGAEGLEQLVRHELVRQEAARQGIAVTPDDVQRKIELDFQYDRDAGLILDLETDPITDTAEPQPTPMTEEAFREQYDYFINDILKPLGISEALYRSWAEAELLEERLREDMAVDVPSEVEQAAYRIIAVADAERADELMARLDSGESFQTLVDEIAADEESVDYVREIDWGPLDQLEVTVGPDLAAALWALRPSNKIQYIPGEEGASHYLVEVVGRGMRAVDEELGALLVQSLFDDWLAEQRATSVQILPYSDRVPSQP
jgi:hypothetical protein